MLISKRRLRWTAVGLLIVCVLLMLRPTRSWIERAWIARALSPQLTVGELIVHSQNSIIEVRDLKWHVDGSNFASNTDGGASGHVQGEISRAFGVNARRCWLGVDRDSLPSGRLRLPKVIFQDADLYLAKSLPSADNSLEDWRQQLAHQIVDFDWETLQRQLHCLPATEVLRLAWRERIESWVKRSRQILVDAALLEHEVDAMDNPLRFEESINAKLARFQQLVDEHRALVSQLGQLEGSLATESARLNQLHQQDLQSFAERSTEANLKLAIDSVHAGFERELAVVLGEAVWNQLAPFGEIVGNVSHAAACLRTADYDVTVRPLEYGSEHLQRSQLKAAGKFQAGLVQSRYRTSGTWRIAQQAPDQTFREFNFFTVFNGDPLNEDTNQIDISSQYDSRQSTSTHLQIVMVSRAQPTVKLPTPQPQADGVPELTHATQATLALQAGMLTGSMTVAPSSLKLLPWKLPTELLDSIGVESNQPLLFELSGGWDQPQLTLSGTTPAWLKQAVEKIAIQQTQAAIAKSKLQLETEFSKQLNQLRQLVDVAAREAREATAADERRLLVSQTHLREQLDLTSGLEFARRPGAVNR